MKKRILTISLLVICLSLCIGGTLAYITANETVRNVITAGNIGIELIQTDADGKPYEEKTAEVYPGVEIDRVVSVENTSDNPCWVRIEVEKEITLAKGKDGKVDLALIEMDLNTKDWTEKDGYFYYNKMLNPGEATQSLFTTISFNGDMDSIYAGCSANVVVSAQAVQSANNGNSVLEAQGWPDK